MKYKGFKMRVRCLNWEQIKTIDEFWYYVSSFVEQEKIVGLGMNWTNDYLYFDYALGVIDDEETLEKLKNIPYK